MRELGLRWNMPTLGRAAEGSGQSRRTGQLRLRRFRTSLIGG
ncbi:MAG TPA: hypothetical protein VGL32_05215 [Acidimicrobiales bacterium]